MRIYAITHNHSGKQYVGCTINSLEKRLCAHAHNSKTVIGRVIQAEGAANFAISLLEEFEGDLDNGREAVWIDTLQTLSPLGYNIVKMSGAASRDKKGRPPVPAERKKKNRAISLTDAEYAELMRQAEAANFGPSAYVVKKLKLS